MEGVPPSLCEVCGWEASRGQPHCYRCYIDETLSYSIRLAARPAQFSRRLKNGGEMEMLPPQVQRKSEKKGVLLGSGFQIAVGIQGACVCYLCLRFSPVLL